ncbi:uncharacterized protein LOC144092921 isoform X2 [Stigmatopora argus]
MKGNQMDTALQLPISALRLLVSPVQLVSAAVWKTIEQQVVTDYGMVEDFVSVVTDILPDLLTDSERTQLIQDLTTRVFPVESGSSYNQTLKSIMELFLIRLEAFLPGQTFKQVASMCGEGPSVLGECLKSMHSYDELKTVLQYNKNHRQHGQNYIRSNDTCIMTAPKNAATNHHCFQDTPECTASPNVESELDMAVQLTVEKDEACGTKEITNKEENIRQINDVCIEENALDGSLSSRPLRPNRGLKMKMILLEEKKGLNSEEDLPVKKCASNQTQSPVQRTPDSSDNADNGSEYSSWSFYTDEDTISNLSSWSSSSSLSDWNEYEVTLDSSSPNSLKEVTSVINGNNPSKAVRAKCVLSQKEDPSKKSRKVECFICHDLVRTSLHTHMRKMHFPSGDYVCHQCNARFKRLSSLKTHLVKTCYDQAQQQIEPRSGQDLYKCDHCEKGFRYKMSLEAHKRTHNELYCSVCRKVLKDAATLERHNASHTGFHCTRCEETFPRFKPLRSHYEHFHNLSKPFKCKCCSNTYSRLEYLIRHEWRDSGHLPFQCNICSLRFRNDCDLVSHQRVHTKEKPYLCGECGKTFSQRTNLLRHHRFLHSESRNEKKHFCADCDRYFKEEGALIKHHKKKHLKELTRHLCPYCGKTFSASAIARHKLLHTGERPLKCTFPDCNKSFLSAPEKKRHVLLHHSTERPFKCDTCGKGFVTIGLRNAHCKIHSGKKPFQCGICCKAFLKRYSMIRHKKLVHAISS